MKILIAPDSFKECLSAKKVAENISIGIRQIIPDTDIVMTPMADGGEGSVESLTTATSGRIVNVIVHDPLMRKTVSFFGLSNNGKTAFIEMAAASGIELLSKTERNPLTTTSYGTGELIKAALKYNVDKIIIGLGGSATIDGGTGMFQALGGKLYNRENKSIGYGGKYISEIKTIDTSQLPAKIFNTEFIIASDVSNPLTGDKGAVKIFGKQKGADKDMLILLEQNMLKYEQTLFDFTGKAIGKIPGAGAAGGLASGLMAFLNAKIENGFNVISKACKLEEKISHTDIVITGEGKIDFQTQYGKTPYGVAMLAKKYNKPVIAIAGALGKNYQTLYEHGFDVIQSIQQAPCTIEESMKNAPILIQQTVQTIIRTLLLNKNNIRNSKR